MSQGLNTPCASWRVSSHQQLTGAELSAIIVWSSQECNSSQGNLHTECAWWWHSISVSAHCLQCCVGAVATLHVISDLWPISWASAPTVLVGHGIWTSWVRTRAESNQWLQKWYLFLPSLMLGIIMIGQGTVQWRRPIVHDWNFPSLIN